MTNLVMFYTEPSIRWLNTGFFQKIYIPFIKLSNSNRDKHSRQDIPIMERNNIKGDTKEHMAY